jgi:hypothetical protein
MVRETTIPAKTVREEIRSLQEFPATPGGEGRVSVVVGRVDEDGAFLFPPQTVTYEITGEHFAALTGNPAAWASDKPAGTYRNADLWHFIDLLRA